MRESSSGWQVGILLLALLIAGCGAKSSKEVETKKLVVGLEGDYTPYNWTTLSADDEISYPFSGQVGLAAGYDVMVAKYLAQQLGMELEIKKISWDGLVLALQNGSIDAIIAGMSPTQERMRVINFSQPYYQEEGTTQLVLVVQADSVYANARARSDFNGAKITAQLGTYHVAVLDQLAGIASSSPLSDYVVLMQSLKAKVIDGYIAELVVASEHIRANPDFVMVSLEGEEALQIPLGYGALAIGLRKSDALLQEQIDVALATLSVQMRQEMMTRAKEAAAKL
jgi:putative lysine transport system substrate-binding protein